MSTTDTCAAALRARIAEMAGNMATQDNRATANPIFMVQVHKKDCGYDPRWSNSIMWVDTSGDCYEEDPEKHAELEALHDACEPTGSWVRTGYKERWENVQPFFTEAGAKEYIRVNGHNLKTPRIYVESAWRNQEWQDVQAFVPAALSALSLAADALEGIKNAHEKMVSEAPTADSREWWQLAHAEQDAILGIDSTLSAMAQAIGGEA